MNNNIGDCYFCKQPVYASVGQLIKYKIIHSPHGKKEYATHKGCRKKR